MRLANASPGEVVSASWVSNDGAGGIPGCIKYSQPTGGIYYRITAARPLGNGVTEFTTSAPHGYTTGTQISFQGMGSNSDWGLINRTFGKSGGVLNSARGFFLTVTAPDKFTVPIDSSNWPAYNASPGGRCQRWAIGEGSWNRPLSPIVAGSNGKSTPDWARNGRMTRRVWSGPSNASSWRTGWYGHSDYHSTQLTTADWDGDEYYLQYRVKFSANRFNIPDQPFGKLVMHSGVHSDVDHLIEQAVAHYNPAEKAFNWDQFRSDYATDPDGIITAIPRMYGTKWAYAAITSPPWDYTSSSYSYQTDKYAGTCTSLGRKSNGVNACWWWPVEQWVTVLIHVKFGKNNSKDDFMDDNATSSKDMTIELWVAKEGETQYTKIFSENRLSWRWDAVGAICGWNAVRLTAYCNEVPAVEGFDHYFDQVILSHEFIPCPQV